MKANLSIKAILLTFFISFSVFSQISFEPEEKIKRGEGRLAWSDNFKLVGNYALIWDEDFLFTFEQSTENEITLLKKQALKLPQETKIVPYKNRDMFISFPDPSYQMTTYAEIYSFEDGQWGKIKEIALPENFSEIFGYSYEYLELSFTPDNMLLYPMVRDRASFQSDIPIFLLKSDSLEIVQMLPAENSNVSVVYDSINDKLLHLSVSDTDSSFITIYDYTLQSGVFNSIGSIELSLNNYNTMDIISGLQGQIELYFITYYNDTLAMRLDYQSLSVANISVGNNVLTNQVSQLIQYNNSLVNFTTGWYFDGNNFSDDYQKQLSSHNLTSYTVQDNQLILDREMAQSIDENFSKQQRLLVARDNTLWLFQNGRGLSILDNSFAKQNIYLFDENNNWASSKVWSKIFNEKTGTLTFNDKKGMYQANLLQEQALEFKGYDNLTEQLEREGYLTGNKFIQTQFGSLVLGKAFGYGETFSLFKVATNFEFESIELPTQLSGARWHKFGNHSGSSLFAKNINTLFINLDMESGQYAGLYVIQFDENLNIVNVTQNNEERSISSVSRYLYVNDHFVVISGKYLISYMLNSDGGLVKKQEYTMEQGQWYMGNSEAIDNGINTGQFIFRMDDNAKWYLIELDQNGVFTERSLPQNISDPHLKGDSEYLSTIQCELNFIDEFYVRFCDNFYSVSADKQHWKLLSKPNFEYVHIDFIYDMDINVNEKALLIKDSYTQIFNIFRSPVVTKNPEISMKAEETININLNEYVSDVDAGDILNFSITQPPLFVSVSDAGSLSITKPDSGTYQLDIEVTDNHFLSVVLPVSIIVSEESNSEAPNGSDNNTSSEGKSGGSFSFLLLLLVYFCNRKRAVVTSFLKVKNLPS